MDIKAGYCIIFYLAFSNSQSVTSQENSNEPIRHNAIAAPEMVSVGISVSPTEEESIFVGWPQLDAVDSYTLRLYTSEDEVLQREITNLKYTAFLIEDLEEGTNYYLTVSAIYRNGDILVESQESERVDFKTHDRCTGGQVLTPCNGHCPSTCENPDPVCARHCIRGCSCPSTASIWHGGLCIVSEMCPTVRGVPVRVTGLSAVESRVPGSDVQLSWDFNPDATFYEIQVRLATNTSVIVQTLETVIPVTTVSNLEPFEVYTFTVRAFIRRPTVSARSALFPPPGVVVTNIGENTFTVRWLSLDNAIRYSFVLFDETRNHILYENGQIGGNSVLVSDLAPGTKYYYSLAAAGPAENVGRYSPLMPVMTLGKNIEGIVENGETIVMAVRGQATTVRPSITSGNTACSQEYKSVERFYETFPNATGGPRYPACDEDGLYVTTVCDAKDSSACWCVDPEDEEKLRGSDFGGPNSEFPLNCDEYGSLEVDDEINLHVIEVHSSFLKVEWSKVQEAHLYILYIQDLLLHSEETISLNKNQLKYTFTNLHAGESYMIGVYVVDESGSSSPMMLVEAKTALVHTPEKLRIVSNGADRVTVSWKVDPNAEGFNIKLINAETLEVLEMLDEVIDDKITFTGLNTFSRYIIEVRAMARSYDDYGNEEVHLSEPATIEVLVQCTLPPVDIIFAFDISKSVTWAGLQATKNLASNILTALPPIEDVNGTRVAAVRYYSDARTIFTYNRYKQTANAVGGIKYIRYNGRSKLLTGKMLDLLHNDFFVSPLNGNYIKRKDALSVVVVFSTGTSYDVYSGAAARLKRQTNVISVGVMGHSNVAQMNRISSDAKLSILAQNFGKLEDASDIVLQRLCTLVE